MDAPKAAKRKRRAQSRPCASITFIRGLTILATTSYSAVSNGWSTGSNRKRTFELLNVNSRGQDKINYGLTKSAIDRANSEADLIIVGGSNLYEGSYRWRWGVHLEVEALKNLRVPLFLLGIGSGSNFGSPLHNPSTRAKSEIKLLNDYATFSGARDVITFEWLQQLGLSKVKLTGTRRLLFLISPIAHTTTVMS